MMFNKKRDILLISIFLTFCITTILLNTIYLSCPECSGSGKIGLTSFISIKDLTYRVITTACGAEWWDISFFVTNSRNTSLHVMFYIEASDPRDNRIYYNTIWSAYLKPYEGRFMNGTEYISLQEHIDLVFNVLPKVEGESEGEQLCPLCNGSGKVNMIGYLKYYLR